MKSGALGTQASLAERSGWERTTARMAVPAGRALLALVFLLGGPMHFKQSTIAYAASAGVPLAEVLVPLAGMVAIAGGLSVLVGFHARWGAALLVLFLVPVTLFMHRFWAESDPMRAMVQQSAFLKNLAILGGALLVLHWGAGPVSVDSARGLKKRW